MKKIWCFFTVFLALALFAVPVSAEGEKGSKTVRKYSPDPSSYKTISEEEAMKSENYSGSDQIETNVEATVLPSTSVDESETSTSVDESEKDNQ
jgi:hypothetical protein